MAGHTEGARFWPAVPDDLHRRGVGDVLNASVDGLTGFPEAIAAVFSQSRVQTCIVHRIRASLRYVNYRDRCTLAKDLLPAHTAADADALIYLAIERADYRAGDNRQATSLAALEIHTEGRTPSPVG